MGHQAKETLTFLDDDISRFMEESLSRRGEPGPEPHRDAGFYETALRVIGRYMDEQKPRDVFFFEQDGAFVVRLFQTAQQGGQHILAEFTRDDIAELVARGPQLRVPDPGTDRQGVREGLMPTRTSEPPPIHPNRTEEPT